MRVFDKDSCWVWSICAVDDADVMKIVKIEKDNDRDVWNDCDSWIDDELWDNSNCEILSNLFFWYWIAENNVL